MNTKRLFKTLAATAIVLMVQTSFGATSESDDDVISYDDIIKELTRSQSSSTSRLAPIPRDPLDDVMLHGGVGLVNMLATIRHDGGNRTYVSQRGVQASLGIDLFSKTWMAEGSFRNFGQEEHSRTTVALKEFDLKLIWRRYLANSIGLRAGGGLTARYLTITPAGESPREYNTPSSVALLGLDVFLSDGLSLGAELSTRNTMIDETLDRSATDLTLRIDTHF